MVYIQYYYLFTSVNPRTGLVVYFFRPTLQISKTSRIFALLLRAAV